MSNTVWAFAATGIAAPELFAAIAIDARRRITEFNTQSMIETMWAFSCVAWAQSQIFSELGARVAGRIGEMDKVAKSQLYLVTSYVQTRWPDLDFALGAHVENCRSAYVDLEPNPPQLQRDVSVALERMGWNHRFNHETDEGFFLDLAELEAKVGIEVDDPSHYLTDVVSGEYILNGATQFKSRLLRGLGWRISHVAFFEFDGKSDRERRELLARKLVEIGAEHERTVK